MEPLTTHEVYAALSKDIVIAYKSEAGKPMRLMTYCPRDQCYMISVGTRHYGTFSITEAVDIYNNWHPEDGE